jgi:electron transfer flavoprotein beta subunit
VGLSAAWSTVKDALPRPARAGGVKVTDEGEGGNKLAEFLVEKRLA